jgi:Ca2+-binding RTX toxin-like protein
LLGWATTGPVFTNHITLLNIENLEGDTGNDTLIGDNGANVIGGGPGNDLLTGNGGADTFFYTPIVVAATLDLGGHDTITDFLHGTDKINVAAIDSNTGLIGNQAFIWGGVAPTAHGAWYTDDGVNTTVHFDTNGSTAIDDLTVTLNGTALGLGIGDFIL